MDFIERIFGISPDGGSGATEAMIIVAVIAMELVDLFSSPATAQVATK